jgi:hypothetical protein
MTNVYGSLLAIFRNLVSFPYRYDGYDAFVAVEYRVINYMQHYGPSDGAI